MRSKVSKRRRQDKGRFYRRYAIRMGINPHHYTRKHLAQIGRRLYYMHYYLQKTGILQKLEEKLWDLNYTPDYTPEDVRSVVNDTIREIEKIIANSEEKRRDRKEKKN
jgi:hypothetical protein